MDHLLQINFILDRDTQQTKTHISKLVLCDQLMTALLEVNQVSDA